jgi:hypothetical protein
MAIDLKEAGTIIAMVTGGVALLGAVGGYFVSATRLDDKVQLLEERHQAQREAAHRANEELQVQIKEIKQQLWREAEAFQSRINALEQANGKLEIKQQFWHDSEAFQSRINALELQVNQSSARH